MTHRSHLEMVPSDLDPEYFLSLICKVCDRKGLRQWQLNFTILKYIKKKKLEMSHH